MNPQENTAKLPDPQFQNDAWSVSVFAQSVAKVAADLANNADKTSPNYPQYKSFFDENIPKFKVLLDNLANDLK